MQSAVQSRTRYYFKLSHLPCQWTSNQPWWDWLSAAQQAGGVGRTEDTETTQRQKQLFQPVYSHGQDLSCQAIRWCVWRMVYILESDLHTHKHSQTEDQRLICSNAKISAFRFCCFVGSFVLVYVFQVFCIYSIRKWNQQAKYVLQKTLQRPIDWKCSTVVRSECCRSEDCLPNLGLVPSLWNSLYLPTSV